MFLSVCYLGSLGNEDIYVIGSEVKTMYVCSASTEVRNETCPYLMQ